MIKQILQFIKKTQFAVKLARAGLFPLIKSLKTFRFSKIFAIFFCRTSKESLQKSLDSFCQKHKQDKVFCAFAGTIFSAAPLFGLPLYFIKDLKKQNFDTEITLKNTTDFASYGFYLNLLKELIKKDFPQAKGAEICFKKHIDIIYDFRLWGADLEELKKALPQSYDINWPQTTQESLRLTFLQKYRTLAKLSGKAQKNTVAYFARLFFEQHLFISDWKSILCSEKNDIALLEISPIQILLSEDLLFIKNYLQKKQKPATFKQSQMIYSLEKLRQSCPDVDLNKAWDETLKQNFVKSKAVDSSFLSSLKKHGVIYTKENHISFPKADSLRYLLDSSRHKKDPRFKKSSLLYALLLLLACWLCLNF